jgi:hypothetical protein
LGGLVREHFINPTLEEHLADAKKLESKMDKSEHSARDE